MKRYLRLFLTMTISSILAFGLASCSSDDNDFGDWASIVTVNEISTGRYDFTLDNGEKLWIASPSNINLKPKYNRAIIYYSLSDDKKEGYDQTIKLYRFYDVLTKNAVYIPSDDKEMQDSIGHDYVKVHSMWGGGDYLNISFGYNAAGNEAHMINLVSDKEDLGVNDNIVKLQFRHNQNGDAQYYPAEGYVSFDLSDYKIEGRDKVEFEISWTDFGGQSMSKKIEYDFRKDKNGQTGAVSENYNTNLNIY